MYRGFENLFVIHGSCVYKTLAGISDDINSVLTRRWTLFAQTEKPLGKIQLFLQINV
jgi:hypothetical protein